MFHQQAVRHLHDRCLIEQRDSQMRRKEFMQQNQKNGHTCEADHGALKQVIKPTGGFQSSRTATATITGFEASPSRGAWV